MKQMNLMEGERLKEEGIARVTLHNQSWVATARQYARRIALIRGTVTACEVREVLDRRGLKPEHPNAWGSVFRGKEWIFTGEWRKSHAPSRHAAVVRVWRLR